MTPLLCINCSACDKMNASTISPAAMPKLLDTKR